jgi:phytoene dehydrogenase-like protein
MSTRTHDAIIIGGGHNGLVCAAYLGMAGLKVKVLERRAVVGGAAVTEEFYPGFRNSIAAYTVSLLNPKVIRDLPFTTMACESSSAVRKISSDARWPPSRRRGTHRAGGCRFSRRDAERLDAFNREIDTGANALRDLVLQAPPI